MALGHNADARLTRAGPPTEPDEDAGRMKYRNGAECDRRRMDLQPERWSVHRLRCPTSGGQPSGRRGGCARSRAGLHRRHAHLFIANDHVLR